MQLFIKLIDGSTVPLDVDAGDSFSTFQELFLHEIRDLIKDGVVPVYGVDYWIVYGGTILKGDEIKSLNSASR